MIRLVTVAVAVAAVALAGCGSDDKASDNKPSTANNPSNQTSQTTENENVPGATAAGGALEVHMQNFAFQPAKVTARVGQTIKFVNDDDVGHNAVAQSGASFKSPTFGKDGTFETKLANAGKITYVCTLHPKMTGTITVQG